MAKDLRTRNLMLLAGLVLFAVLLTSLVWVLMILRGPAKTL